MVCRGASPCIRGRFLSIPIGPERCGFIPARGGRSNSRIMSHATIRFIPVHTGQMQFCFHLTAVRTAHPRTYGADTKSSKKSSGSMDKRFLLSRLPTIKSVCIISFRYIFADNTFWSKTDGYKIILRFRKYPHPDNASGYSHKNRVLPGNTLILTSKTKKTGYQPAV